MRALNIRTKELQTIGNSGYTSMPYELRLEAATGIQSERPWSQLDPVEIVEQFYAMTANGCLDVYVRDADTGELMGWAQIGCTWDIHVGDMLIVMAQYVRPAYRDAGVSREIIRVLKRATREAGLRWCCFTHWSRAKRLVWNYIDLGE